jgi:hypothetical protein
MIWIATAATLVMVPVTVMAGFILRLAGKINREQEDFEREAGEETSNDEAST